MEVSVYFQKLCQVETRRLVMLMGMLVSVVLVIQSLMLPSGNPVSSLFPAIKVPVIVTRSFSTEESSAKTAKVGEIQLLNDSMDLKHPSGIQASVKSAYTSGMEGAVDFDNDRDSDIDFDFENDRDPGDDLALDGDGDPEGKFLVEKVVDQENDIKSKKATDPDKFTAPIKASSDETELLPEKTSRLSDDIALDNVRKPDISMEVEFRNLANDNDVATPRITSTPIVSDMNQIMLRNIGSNLADPLPSVVPNTLLDKETTEMISKGENLGLLQSGPGTLNENSTTASVTLKKKRKQIMPPTSMPEMNHMLLRNRVSSRSMKPRWSSIRDQEILSIRTQIENAPIVRNDPELYAPVFRNVSLFKRSYELMEHMLRVYIYREGGKPIFHTPILKGLYASEGWFMRLMEGNKHFCVKDPQKAHLFYMPFSSRFLEVALYVPGSHNRKKLAEHLKNYVDKIASKYPFWNRTGGTDHFLVACHDWAPYETRHHMERSIRALCNADLSEGFKLGKDVSLPETFVRSPQNPLRDVGGRPASKRSILAFFAGNMHGRLRPILLKHWENKDPDMKIFGPMPHAVKKKMTYIQYMKSSKYCICPRGYEVNSPRVVEAIFYECVPVIISDNFVAPFFEVLDWEAFAVFVAEKDVPNLKDILLSIPKEKYLAMQLNLKNVQRHFLWHSNPVKYDSFHMILHSIWFNRVHTIKPR
ncbi:hypothetical protein AAC387_Pa02g2630 [Persea americana]